LPGADASLGVVPLSSTDAIRIVVSHYDAGRDIYIYIYRLTSFLPMLLKKHMVTDPIVFQIIISQNQNN